jgi:HSP20 family protein
MNQVFDDFFNDRWPVALFNQNGMKVDIKETDKEYVVEAEIPGVDKKDIQVELENGLLTIAVKRDEQVNVEGENYIRRERRYSGMKRSFHVDNVKEDGVKASYTNGVLTITLPKRSPGKTSRSIVID